MSDTRLEDTRRLQVIHKKTNVSLHTVRRIVNSTDKSGMIICVFMMSGAWERRVTEFQPQSMSVDGWQ